VTLHGNLMKQLTSDINKKMRLPLLLIIFFIFSGSKIFSQPVAAFTASPLTGCSPLVISFTDQSTGSPTSWLWDLGNGTTSTQQNPTTTYLSSGFYTIILTVSNASGSNTVTKAQYIKVDDKPTVDFGASINAGCFPLRVNFTDFSTGGSAPIVAWEWDFGDGSISSAQNPSYIYTTAGNYSVTLKVTNAGGCTKVVSKPNYMQVSAGVTVNFSNSTATQCKPPETISFTNSSTGPGTLSYQWFFGDGGNSVTQNPNHTYVTGGVFNVTFIVQSNLGCVDTLVKPAAVVIKDVTSAFIGPSSVCQGITASFTNTSVPVSAASFWDFGDGTFSTLTNPGKAYAAPGVYNVKLRNDYGTCFDSVVRTITVLGLPTPDFNAPDVIDCKAPFTVNFNNISVGGTSWLWNFGDGGTSTLQTPSHTYNATGNYTVSLIATGANGCSDSIIKPQFVRIQAPIVAINGLPIEGCVPFTISPNPNVTAIDGVAGYLWDFGDGFTSAAANPSHTYPVQGNYTVKLFITTNDGCTDSSVMVNAVRVGNKSIANFSAIPLSQCVGQPVQFTNLTTPSDRWLWNFGDGSGTSTTQNPQYSYQDTGRFTVRLIAWNNGCADTAIKINYITALPPVARFNTTFNCGNKLQVVFTDQSVLPQTWFWNFGDGFTSSAQNPTHIYSSFGVFNVSLTVTNGSCSHTRTIPLTLINESANFNVLRDTICANQTATFQAAGFNQANITSYFWDFGDGSSSAGGALINHIYTAAGRYSVTLTITDNNGCVSTISRANIVQVWGPVADFSFNPSTGCRPLTVNFTDRTQTDGTHPIVTWIWNYGNGSSLTTNAPPFSYTYDTAGYFNPRLTVLDSYGCSSFFFNTNDIYITNPKAAFTSTDTLTCAGKTVNFTNTSTGATLTYNWDFGDGTFSTVLNPVKIYPADGNYTIRLTVTDVNGCTNTSTKTAYIKVHTVKASFTVSDSVSSCTPFEVNFVNTSLYWKSNIWSFGDGNTSTREKPTNYYNTPGTYIVRMIVDGPGGCIDSAFKTITLYPSTATLTYTPLSGCSPLPVTFHISTPGPVTYLWDFSDGNTFATTDSNIVYNYLLPGDFVPKVIMEDQTGCQIPVQGIDTIHVTRSFVNFGADDSLHCGFGIVNFTDSTTSNATITSYNWSFGDGGTSTLQNPTHTYNTAGLYSVRLVVTTANGCRDTLIKPNYIKVVANPVADITGNIPICLYDKLKFRGILLAPDTSAVKWFWNFGNGKTAIIQNPLSQVYDTAGSYPLRLIVTNSTGCADTVDRTVVVYPLPVIDAGPNQTILVGSSATITPSGSPVVNYLWTPATALNCTSCYNTIASPKNTTTYTIKVTDINGCINSDNVTIIVLCNDKNLFIPNTFSPNNDGINDWFYPRGTGLFKIQSMRIFNRWGEMVFQKANITPNDATGGWNGRYNGKLLTSDVYTYLIEIICENSEVLTFKGNISLIQ
jgi:gliding motility-associated-like protein